MPLKEYRPFTPSSRYKLLPDFAEITTSKPEKSLTKAKKRSGGRNNNGRITCRHRGGGHKRRLRMVDFKRTRRDEIATVLTVEYDPNRTARIALIEYKKGGKAYIIAPKGLVVGAEVSAGTDAAIKPGCALPLSAIPIGSSIHCIELIPGRGAQVARSAGQHCVLSSRDGGYAQVKMPSGEIRKVIDTCYATIGVVGNGDHMNVVSAKAGRSRWQGIRPTVRGMCMNPVDHPNGGGEGKSKSGGGRQHLKSPWGHVKGQRTRAKYKPTDKFILQRRKKKNSKR